MRIRRWAARALISMASAIACVACGSEQERPTDQPTRSPGLEITSPDEGAAVLSPFVFSAEAQLTGTVVWRVLGPSAETLVDWRSVSALRVSDPSGHAELDVSVALPSGVSGPIALEVGMRAGEDAPPEHVARRELTVVPPGGP